jgi:hypothetical protein
MAAAMRPFGEGFAIRGQHNPGGASFLKNESDMLGKIPAIVAIFY